MDSEDRNGAEVSLGLAVVLPIYDPAPLDAFIADLGDEASGIRVSLFEAFLDDSTNRFVPLVAAHNDAKRAVLASLAHTMRSSSGALGLVALSAAATDIDIALRTAPEQVDVPLESTRLLNEFQRATMAIGALLKAELPKALPRGDPPGTTPTVLLVEDDLVSQRACAAILTKLGYNTNIVDNGADALKELERRRYAAVLMDFRMPVMDGFLTTLELRRREGSARHTPVIALTSPTTEWDREMCLGAGGMDEYLTKPVDVAELTAALRHWVPAIDR